MARDFTKNTSNYLGLGINAISPLLSGAAAISFHCWVYVDTLHGSAADADDLFSVQLSNTQAGFAARLTTSTGIGRLRVQARSGTGDASQSITGATTLSTGQWYSLGGVVNIASDTITVYVNGVSDNSGGVTFANATYTPGTPTTAGDSIGCAMTATTPISTTRQLDGRIADLAIWTADIGVNAFVALARGRRGWDVAPGSLVFFMPLHGVDSPEYDWKSRKVGTITGTVAFGTHAPVVPYSRRFGGSPYLEFGTAYSETGRILATLLAQTGRTDVQAMSEAGRAAAMLLALSGVTNVRAMTEAGLPLATLLTLTGQTDARAMSEAALTAALLLAQTGNADAQAMLESGKAVPLLALTGATDLKGYVEFDLGVLLLALTGQTNVVALSETGKAVPITVLTSAADVQAMLESGLAVSVLVLTGLTDTFSGESGGFVLLTPGRAAETLTGARLSEILRGGRLRN
jgi:hypothetical protein